LVTITVPVDETWHLEEIFADDASFESAKRQLSDSLPSLGQWSGRLDESAATLADALEQITELFKGLARLRCYTALRSDRDTCDVGNQALRQEIEILATDVLRSISYLRPELLAMDEQQIEFFIAEENRLDQHAFYLRDLIRQKPHVLEPGEERIMAESRLVTSGAPALYRVLHNAELPRPEVELENGERVLLTPVSFQKHRTDPSRENRRRIFPEHFAAYNAFKETLANNLSSTIKAHIFSSRSRGYGSCLAASLDGDNVPKAVYHNLIEQVHRHLPLLHRYMALRKKALGVERLEYIDLHCPLSDSPPNDLSTAKAMEIVQESLSPLGGEYTKGLEEAFARRWIDWHPAPGKRAGAYASGYAYDVHPFVLINYSGDYESVSTLAHEMGHAMHSYFSNRRQPYATADYSIFVAEVASTLNEALLAQRMIDGATETRDRIFYLASELDSLRGTLFRQAMFAEFELAIHERVERGEAITGERLNELYLELLRRYHGHDSGVMHIAEDYAVEWAAVPHFYYNFYVYQYSTGVIAANALASALFPQTPGAAARYMEFLSAGGSDYPLELLRRSGVDLETEAPYEAAFASLQRLLDRLENLLEDRV
jgi:oligoendopeptidase F